MDHIFCQQGLHMLLTPTPSPFVSMNINYGNLTIGCYNRHFLGPAFLEKLLRYSELGNYL